LKTIALATTHRSIERDARRRTTDDGRDGARDACGDDDAETRAAIGGDATAGRARRTDARERDGG